MEIIQETAYHAQEKETQTSSVEETMTQIKSKAVREMVEKWWEDVGIIQYSSGGLYELFRRPVRRENVDALISSVEEVVAKEAFEAGVTWGWNDPGLPESRSAYVSRGVAGYLSTLNNSGENGGDK